MQILILRHSILISFFLYKDRVGNGGQIEYIAKGFFLWKRALLAASPFSLGYTINNPEQLAHKYREEEEEEGKRKEQNVH